MTKPLELPEWQKKYNTQLSILNEIKENQDLLRFDRKYVIISDISSQYYCEKKVELRYVHGDIDTEEKLLGREGHDEIAQEFVEITVQEGWKQIFTSPRFTLSESLFFAKYKDLYLIFKPDSVLFIDGVPRMLIEFKFSRYKRPFISHHVQLQAEGYLLKKLGFDASSLYYLIVIAPINADRDSKYLSDIPKKIFEKLRPHLNEEHYMFRDINAYLYKFDKITAKKNFRWALEYWRKEREAQLTDNKNKCRSCEYNKSCMKK
jgi:CRISPR/Cas system-associated exonuclease Cas4 (RecB family)